ncbi:MAG TPA: SpoIIE family protein phosphatase [Phycisphaerae bacterium]|nr:SpoIIE family protein phosphatase [Phycisphaerae bacterium]
MAHLEVIMPDGTRRTHALAHRPVTIGREITCDIHLRQESASRRHARILPVEFGYRVEDLGSVNGTWVNNRRVEAARLRHGDRLIIQDFEALFIDDQPDSTVTLSDVGVHEQFRSRTGTLANLEISQRRLKSLYELTSRLTAVRDVQALLDEALTICFDMLEFERGAIGLCKPARQGIDWRVVRNLRGADGGLTLSRTMLSRALNDGERLIFGGDHADFVVTASMVQSSIQAALCVPLVYENEVLGIIYGDRVTSGRNYADEDSDFLFALASQIAVGLTNARLLDEHKEHIRLENEVALARETQRLLFPKSLPATGRVRCAALNIPGHHVSGDYYDAIRIDAQRFAFLIADVSGKGMAASLLGGSLHGMIQATLPDDGAPSKLLAQWNRFVCSHTDGLRYVTCALAIVDLAASALDLAVAGHPPPLMLIPEGPHCRHLTVDVGLPLGIEADFIYVDTRIELPADGCTLLLYTDGVSEAMNARREEFGLARLDQTARTATDRTPDDLVAAVEAAVSHFAAGCPQHDDITLLAVQLAGAHAPAPFTASTSPESPPVR